MNCLFLFIFFSNTVVLEFEDYWMPGHRTTKMCICEDTEITVHDADKSYVVFIEPPKEINAEMRILWQNEPINILWDENIGYVNVREQLKAESPKALPRIKDIRTKGFHE
jgi:hypothetical protein